VSALRIKTDAAIRERYAPEPNPYADYPQTFGCQRIEAVNAMRELMALILVDFARLLRRLPFCD
jgi:hypothetical protein